LARLRELDVPLAVREVTVEPVEAARSSSGRRSLADLFRDDDEPVLTGKETSGGPVPLITDNTALFWVTVEYLDLSGDSWAPPREEEEAGP
jgi:hypothetical protein